MQNSSFAGLIEQMFCAKFARKFAKPVVASLTHEARLTYFWLFLAAHSGCGLHGRAERVFSARWGQAAVQQGEFVRRKACIVQGSIRG